MKIDNPDIFLEDLEHYKDFGDSHLPDCEAENFFFAHRKQLFALARIAIKIGQARKAESRSEIENWSNVAADILGDE